MRWDFLMIFSLKDEALGICTSNQYIHIVLISFLPPTYLQRRPLVTLLQALGVLPGPPPW